MNSTVKVSEAAFKDNKDNKANPVNNFAKQVKQAIRVCALPSLKDEEWKYTDLRRALPDRLLRADCEQEQNREIVIHKSGGQNRGKTEDILWNGCDGIHHKLGLKIVLEDNSEYTLIERHEGQGAYWKNMVSEIIIGENAKLRHIIIQENGKSGVFTNMLSVDIGANASYNGFYFGGGGKLSRQQVYVSMNGQGAQCDLGGISLLNGNQHGDNTVLIEHRSPHCNSSQFFRTILDDKARGVFQGKVLVHKEAQKTDAYQLSNTLLLSSGAEMDTKPELEIYADDVKCSHGATVGQIDEESLFYLRSRGLSDKAARAILIKAFVDEVIDKIEDKFAQDNVRNSAESWLASQEEMQGKRGGAKHGGVSDESSNE